MSLETTLDEFPMDLELKEGFQCSLRPMVREDEDGLYAFFQNVPEEERLFIKHRVEDRETIRQWCGSIDYFHKLPMVAVYEGNLVGVATLHQNLGGWMRHIGRVSVLVLPKYRGRGLARRMIKEIADIARFAGLDSVEAEFLGAQQQAIKMFGLLGFSPLVSLPEYVQDMRGNFYDYVKMSLPLKTPEEYANPG